MGCNGVTWRWRSSFNLCFFLLQNHLDQLVPLFFMRSCENESSLSIVPIFLSVVPLHRTEAIIILLAKLFLQNVLIVQLGDSFLTPFAFGVDFMISNGHAMAPNDSSLFTRKT